jgi:hypothetical protein
LYFMFRKEKEIENKKLKSKTAHWFSKFVLIFSIKAYNNK